MKDLKGFEGFEGLEEFEGLEAFEEFEGLEGLEGLEWLEGLERWCPRSTRVCKSLLPLQPTSLQDSLLLREQNCLFPMSGAIEL